MKSLVLIPLTFLMFMSCSKKSPDNSYLEKVLNKRSKLPIVCMIKFERETHLPVVYFMGFKNKTSFEEINTILSTLNVGLISSIKEAGIEIFDRTDYIENQPSPLYSKHRSIDKTKKPEYVLIASVNSVSIDKLPYGKSFKSLIGLFKRDSDIFTGINTDMLIEKLNKYKITVNISLKILDIEKRTTVFHKTATYSSVESITLYSHNQRIETIKRAVLSCIGQLKKDILKLFPLKAKVIKIKKMGKNIYAYLDKGILHGVYKGDRFKIRIPIVENIDNHFKLCDFVQVPGYIRIIRSEKNYSVGILTGEINYKGNINILALKDYEGL